MRASLGKGLLVSVVLVLVVRVACAQESTRPDAPAGSSPSDLFTRGRFEAALNNGVLFSPFVAENKRPTINYTVSSIQLGYMLGDVNDAGWLRGNFEGALEAFGSGIYEGPGSYISGGTLWLRYNFVQRKGPLVPYFQVGGGVTTTDIDHNLVGQPFNFNLDLGIGLRCFVAKNWTLSLEYRYQHISNADTGNHNLGINAHGPILGVSYLF